MPICKNCGIGDKFYEDAGFFYCELCQVQSQDLQQKTVNEIDYTQQTAFTTRANAFKIGTQTQQLDDEEEDGVLGGGAGLRGPYGIMFTPGKSESVFFLADVVMRAQMEWLVQNAGASEQSKDVWKMVWFQYLSRALPDLKSAATEDILIDCLHPGRSWKKSLYKSDVCAMLDCDLDDLPRLVPKNAHTDSTLAFFEANVENGSPDSSTRRHQRFTGPDKLSFTRMLALLIISLQICEDCILVSDILRWIRQLSMPLIDLAGILPDDQLATFYTLGSLKDPFNFSYPAIEWDVEVTLKFLQIPETCLPEQSLMPLIDRFVDELNLPRDLAIIANDIASDSGLRWTLHFASGKKYRTAIRPQNAEATVMALIIHALIVLFGLNGKTEVEITAHQRILEAFLEKAEGNEPQMPELFDWFEWMEHIDLRRLWLFKHTTLLRSHSVDAELAFIQSKLVAERKKVTLTRLKRHTFRDVNYVDLQSAFQGLHHHHPPAVHFIHCPVTARPFRAHTFELARLDPALAVDFTTFSLAHVTSGLCNRENSPPEVSRCLETIAALQAQANTAACSIESQNLGVTKGRMLLIEQVPSFSVRWLLTVCAEVIDQRPAALLGQLVDLESRLFSSGKR